ncbi:ribonuclease H2 subunit C [Aspergillus homomorphus CBS 101889]|uniref:Putative ribonuclease H2 subunit C n=1 Tax=Aspergillus homomorphus (strain CBS 101889) TaxID=1450537 RepID=A0A395I0T9_ASPHC|nr:putative ribonuclease H2 subunit C [Aspergillus homomorphus CBS 101889]RAL12154.1 putative ribonuclease H2 subunit C [Aspergillus homomorphus CBS 101889]
MFAIQTTPTSSATENQSSMDCFTPNILPCKVHYDGPFKKLDRFWTPRPDEQDKDVQIAYFRGRRLKGRRVAVPEGYEGVIAKSTDRTLPRSRRKIEAEVEEVEPEEPVRILEKQGTFKEYTVWGHELVPAADDAFVRGVEEWIRLAEAMHCQPSSEAKPSS